MIVGSLWPGALKASPAEQFGLGASSQSLAGTGSSYATGFAATFLNPAQLSADPSRQLAIGLHAASFRLATSERSAGSLNDASQSLQLGVVAPLPFPEPLADRLVLGMGVSTAGSRIARVTILHETRAQFPLLARRADSLNANFGLGARLAEGIYAGVGAMLLAGLRGRVSIDAGTEDRSAESLTDDELLLTGAPTAGLAWASEGWRLGATYRAQLRASFDLLVTVENLDLVVLPPFHINGLTQIDPAQLSLEGAYDWDRWRFILAGTFKRWSAIDGFREATVRCPAEQPDCDALPSPKMDLSDTLVPRVALEYRLPLTPGAVAALRAGYFYEATPLAAQTQEARLLDNPRHVLSVGYGIALSDPLPRLSVSWAAQYHHLTERRHSVSPDAITSSGSIVGAGVTAEVGF